MSMEDYAQGVLTGTVVRQESVPVERSKGRSLELQLWTGQARYRNGEVWTVSSVEIADIKNGGGSIRGEQVFAHPDGSTITGSYRGKAKVVPNSNRGTSAGEWTFTAGTGRTAGIKGQGTFKAAMMGDKFVTDFKGKASKGR
jgi:hypothetical protein